MKTLIKSVLLLLLVTALTGCYGPASYNDSPNGVQRAELVNKNALGITVEHSTWGKKIAFRFADEHCASLGKLAVYQGASLQFGYDVISTWTCVDAN